MKSNRYIKLNQSHLQRVLEARRSMEDRLNSESIRVVSTFKLPKNEKV
jgi:hypothetical protein